VLGGRSHAVVIFLRRNKQEAASLPGRHTESNALVSRTLSGPALFRLIITVIHEPFLEAVGQLVPELRYASGVRVQLTLGLILVYSRCEPPSAGPIPSAQPSHPPRRAPPHLPSQTNFALQRRPGPRLWPSTPTGRRSAPWHPASSRAVTESGLILFRAGGIGCIGSGIAAKGGGGRRSRRGK
jgi:hypothetical protein